MKINKQFLNKYLFKGSTLTIITFALAPVLIYSMFQIDNYLTKRENEEYKFNISDKIDKDISGYLVKYSWSDVYSGIKLATLSSGDKFFVTSRSLNYAYEESCYDLFDCLKRGDYISKPANTDSIFVIKRNGRKYFYLAKQSINVELNE